jgi:hypothetical protein
VSDDGTEPQIPIFALQCSVSIQPLTFGPAIPERRLRGADGHVAVRPILLKNPISADHTRIVGRLESEVRFKLGGYQDEVASQRRASDWLTKRDVDRTFNLIDI